jgi:chemotaxis protein histidine kinase CheA
MLVNISENLFAIPVNVIEETLLIKKDEIKDFDEYKVYDLRNETVAILFLSELIGNIVKEEVDEYFVVIVSYEHRKIGLVVDELIGHQNIVIKPLDETLKSLEGIAGATVLGDGKIALILDINMLVRSRKRVLNLMSDALDLFKDKEGGFDGFYDDIQNGKNKSNNKKNQKELEDNDIKITSYKE